MRNWLLLGLIVLTGCAPVVAQPVVLPSTPSPTATPVPPDRSAIAPLDVAPYRAAMRPEFAADLDRFGSATEYQIDLELATDLSVYTGTQRVRFTNQETSPLNEVYFRLFVNTDSYGGRLTVQSIKLNGAAVRPISELGDSALRVPLTEPLAPGGVAQFDLIYAGTVPTRPNALGYDQFGLRGGVLALPNFYPQIPVYDDEGWNVEIAPGQGDAVFSDTALYRVDIRAPADQVIAASGTCEPQAAPIGRQVQRCVSGPMRDFMIAMSGDFEVATEVVDGIHVNSYYLSRDEAGGQRGLRNTVDAVKSFNRRIGPYPFAELDLVETPTTAGGIEYPGLIVIAQELYRANETFREGATAHEVAHQWWYSLVGNDQIDDPWLDEALTQFTTALYYRDKYGAAGFSAYVTADLNRRYDRVKGTVEDRRSDLPVAAYSGRQYSALVYGKAALFFNGLYEAMGDEKFDQFMQTYFNTHRYGVAYVADLLAAAETQLDRTAIDRLMAQWITTPE